jgi:hypothetical protein
MLVEFCQSTSLLTCQGVGFEIRFRAGLRSLGERSIRVYTLAGCRDKRRELL